MACQGKMNCTKQPFLMLSLKGLAMHSGLFQNRSQSRETLKWIFQSELFSSICFCLQSSQKGWEESAERRHRIIVYCVNFFISYFVRMQALNEGIKTHPLY